MLTLFALALPLNLNFASAATPAENPNQTAIVEKTPIHDSKDNTSYSNSHNLQNTPQIAAGSTTTGISTNTVMDPAVGITSNQLNEAASSLKTFVDTNHRLPNYVTVAGQQITIPQFLMLLDENLLNINNGQNNPLTITEVADPTNPAESVKSGNIQKTEYVQLLQNFNNFVNANGRLPNYVRSSLGNIRYESLVYMSSKLINFYTTNGRLPTYVAVTSWASQSSQDTIITDSSLQKYLQPTNNCQSTSTTIKTLAESITAGLTSNYTKAEKIFNWVRDNLSYSYYYNTKKGALGSLSSRSANCCDHSHLVIALARAEGIPGRYVHVYGHVYSQLYVNGIWYNADAINNNNYFGQSKSTSNILGIYAELPF